MSFHSMMKRSGADVAAIRYRAFVSYSHRDAGWAKWLHRQLQGFSLDKDLVGRKTSLGPAPKRLRPIFRDSEDYSGSDALTDATIAALDRSAAVVVVCSPSVAGRTAVNREVRWFRLHHPDRPVIPVIVGGTRPDNIPGALRFEQDADGTLLSDRPVTVTGPDLRAGGDGRRLALAKTVAGLTGLAADEVCRRAERARRRRGLVWAGVAGAFFLGAVVAASGAVYVWHKLKSDDVLLNAALKTAPDAVGWGVSQAQVRNIQKYNVVRGVTLKLLGEADALFDDLAQFQRPTAQLQYGKARMLVEFARGYQALGNAEKMRARASDAYGAMAGLDADRLDDTAYQRDLSMLYGTIGDMQLEQGLASEALKAYRDGHAILGRLVAADPANAAWQRDLAMSCEKVGDVLVQLGLLSEALASYRDGQDIFRQLAAADPDNVRRQRDMAASFGKIGDLLLDQGALPEALKSYRDGQDIFERLAAAETGNVGRQRDLAASAIKIGDVLLAQGRPSEALASYRDGQDVLERLAAAEPVNAGWQRDLATSYDKIGDVLVARGLLPQALKSYRDGQGIFARLASADSANAGWQRSLSVSYGEIGDVLTAQGRLSEALKSYRDGHDIIERLVQSDPDNLNWRRDLSASYSKLATALRRAGDTTHALGMLRQGRAVMLRLTSLSPDHAGWKHDLAWFDRQIAELASTARLAVGPPGAGEGLTAPR